MIRELLTHDYRIGSRQLSALGLGAVGFGDKCSQVNFGSADGRMRADGDLAASSENG